MASGGPIWLVECSWHGNIRVNPEAVGILSRLPPPLRVVSIFGPRQSGKSYLLDVLAGSTGFAASKGDSPDDLRINMWTLPDTEDPGHTLVLLDTEGFEEDLGIEAAAFTCPIFTLSLLLSSVFLYNTRGPVSTDALDQLLHVTMLANQVSLPAISWAGESLLPEFVWCVRDYDLDVAMGDVELMPEDFLDSVFNDAKGLQSPAGVVCELFARERMEIFDFCHPQSGAETLEGVPLSELEPRFTRQAKALKKSICRSDPKVLQDCRALSGADLGDILNQFVESLSRGSLIQLDGVIGESSRAENAQDLDLPRDCEVPTTEVLPRYTEVPREVQGPVVEREMPLREAPARPYGESSATGTADRITVGRHFVDMDRPVCLIENTSAGELQVNQESLDILRSIRQPVVVVSIVGLYRTGKSYLMNRLAGKQTGFSLGSTVQSETKGIWMWCVPHPHKDDQTLVLLDTEGLGDVEKGDQKNDTWIFSLAVLLSSTLVYNSMGTINNEAVMSLQADRAHQGEVHKGGTEETSSDYVRFFPTFVWAVRDFTLELEIDGKTATADQYLENSLKLKNGSSRAVALSNDARECIRNYFPERKCFVFDQPGSKEKLKLLDRLADSELDPQFVKQTSDFCGYVFGCSKEKTVKGGITVTGSCKFDGIGFAEKEKHFLDVERVRKAYEDKCTENEEMSRNHCIALLLQLADDMEPEESYMKPGGYQRFKAHLDKLVELYKSALGKGVKAEEALEDYLSEKNQLEKIILTADRNLSEQQRHLEEQRAQTERAKQRAAAAREQQEALERRMNDVERARRENERQLMEKMERDRRALLAENQQVMDQRLREQRALLEEGYNSRAERWDGEIRQLREELASQRETEEEEEEAVSFPKDWSQMGKMRVLPPVHSFLFWVHSHWR
ncbi:hypothetical protein ANANG_G00096040 [Anguilla anguilla]|uniref:GB1/RHD3-type G domain-containing protein n=1 Tax=Anguilla anguilla TaxID=7936 RepID=A0A9D3MFZ1_ANGAN|nr:hypothetical protein ANANG_G00096040 [Anguilla anguilla]